MFIPDTYGDTNYPQGKQKNSEVTKGNFPLRDLCGSSVNSTVKIYVLILVRL